MHFLKFYKQASDSKNKDQIYLSHSQDDKGFEQIKFACTL